MQNYEVHGAHSVLLTPLIIVMKIKILQETSKRHSQQAWFHSLIEEEGGTKCNYMKDEMYTM